MKTYLFLLNTLCLLAETVLSQKLVNSFLILPKFVFLVFVVQLIPDNYSYQ